MSWREPSSPVAIARGNTEFQHIKSQTSFHTKVLDQNISAIFIPYNLYGLFSRGGRDWVDILFPFCPAAYLKQYLLWVKSHFLSVPWMLRCLSGFFYKCIFIYCNSQKNIVTFSIFLPWNIPKHSENDFTKMVHNSPLLIHKESKKVSLRNLWSADEPLAFSSVYLVFFLNLVSEADKRWTFF